MRITFSWNKMIFVKENNHRNFLRFTLILFLAMTLFTLLNTRTLSNYDEIIFRYGIFKKPEEHSKDSWVLKLSS